MRSLWRRRLLAAALIGLIFVAAVWQAHDDRRSWLLVAVIATGAVASALVSNLLDRWWPSCAVEQIAGRLASQLLTRYSEQIQRLGIGGGVPLTVRYRSTSRPAAGRTAVMEDDTTAAVTIDDGWSRLPLDSDVHQIVEVFRALPRRQLVIIGDPGAGKTVLVMKLAAGLLKKPWPGEPVPVLLSISGWNPETDSLEQFLARHLIDEPVITGATEAETLAVHPRVSTDGTVGHWVLPIADGLDEIRAEWRIRALQRLEEFAAAGEGRPLVITCRGREYSAIVAAAQRVLPRAAVVEIQPVTPTEATDFLRQGLSDTSRWTEVFDQLDNQPDGALSRTLTTPLMVAIARAAYRDPRSRPQKLTVATSRKHAQGLLIDRYIAAVYDPTDPTLAAGHRLHTYPSGKPARWLGTVGYVMYLAGTRDLVWDSLVLGLMSPRPRRVRAAWSTAWMITGTASTTAVGAHFGLPMWWIALATAAATGVIVWILTRWRPARIRLAKLQLAMTGRLPYRLNRFLDDAYERGIVRHNGARRQFRHVFIQDHLIRDIHVTVLRRRADTGYWDFTSELTALLHERGDIDELQRRSETGYWPARRAAAKALAELLRQRGDIDELRRRADNNDEYADSELAELLRQRGDIDELRDRAQRWAASRAGSVLAELLHEIGDIDELRRWADASDDYAGSGLAAYALADLLRDGGDIDELRRRANAGGWAGESAAGALAELLRESGDIDELHHQADAGSWAATKALAAMLRERGNIDEAIAVLRRHKYTFYGTGAGELAALLRERGDINELRHWTDAGSEYAARELAALLRERGDINELRRWTEIGNAYAASAARALADLLREQGNIDEAITILRRHADTGGRDTTRTITDDRALAARALAAILREHGHIDEAVAVLRRHADIGDRTAGSELAALLRERGDIGSAAIGELQVRE